MICVYCNSSNVEKRGTRMRDGEEYQRIKCSACNKWSRLLIGFENVPTYVYDKYGIAEISKSKKYIISSAQNNTALDQRFWKAILKYAEHFKAQILIVPVLYKVRTNKLDSKDAWWPPEVEPYLVQNDIKLINGVRLMAHVPIVAPATNPLTGFESLSQADSAIFGHGQIQMRTIPTPQRRLPKILQTTGSVSEKNYTRSKAGIKGDFHHSLGAVIVEESENGNAHIRGIIGDENSEFYDLDYHCTAKQVKKVTSIPAIVLGDEHVIDSCPDVQEATFGTDGIVQSCRPLYIVRHDVIDAYSVSHHHRNSPSIRYQKYWEETDRLEDELKQTARHIENTTPSFSTSVIVPSNHHNHISRWLEESDWRNEMWNARIYHELWAEWLAHIEARQQFHPFTWWMQQNCTADVMYLLEDYPFIVNGIYLGYHGDRGLNGAKGNIKSFAKIGAKTVVGHLHTPGIEKGCYQTGISSILNPSYTSGPSSWMNTHALIHPSGKRQLVHIIRGEYRA